MNLKRKILTILILFFIFSFNLFIVEAEKELNEDKNALIINTSEFLYGSRYCDIISKNLQNLDYNIEYLSNERVTLDFIKYNLSAEIVYMNTHAAFWDTDNDNIKDTIVVATGEKWDDDTEVKYCFEYNNDMIIKCQIIDDFYIAFTPLLIEYYYDLGDFPSSLIYLATCDSSFDDSMAECFLNAGAAVYIGWTKTTTSWTNQITSIFSFKLLKEGFDVNQVCSIIRAGGFFNFLFRTKLKYFGDGEFKL